MQVSDELLEAAAAAAPATRSRKTIMGHPGAAAPAANAVRGAKKTKRRNQTLAMDGAALRNSNLMPKPAPSGGGGAGIEADEKTVAMNVDDLLDAIDGPDVDEDDVMTMAVAAPDYSKPRRSAPAARSRAPEPEPEPEYEDEDFEDESTMALSIEELGLPKRAPKPKPKPAPKPKAPSVPIDAIAHSPAKDGFFPSMGYALGFDGRRIQLEDRIAALEAAGDSTHLAEYRKALASMDPAAAKKGWINFGSLMGGITVVILVLGLIF